MSGAPRPCRAPPPLALPAALALVVAGCGGGGGAADALCLPAATGAPQELVAHARLRASGTRPGSFGLHEEEDGVQALRGQNPGTAWRAPLGRSTLSVDLQPWLRSRAPLQSLELSSVSPGPVRATVTLLDGCGGTPLVRMDWPDVRAPLGLGGRSAGCVELELETDEPFDVEALRLLARAGLRLRASDADRLVPALQRFPGSGVVEGFYGQPWTWRERADTVRLLAALGLDTYVYAPKSDPLHRQRWRESYPEEALAELRALHSLATAQGVELTFAASPFIDFDFASDADHHALLGKLSSILAATGITSFGLFADDIELAADVEPDGALGTKHVAVANRLLSELRRADAGARLSFVGTVYSDERARSFPAGRDYLEALSALDPSIRLYWTGPGTFAAELQGSELAPVTAATGRRPVLWENYWANDQLHWLEGSVTLSAFGGRTEALPPAVDGIHLNPMIQGALARLQLGMFARYLERPGEAAPDAQRAHAAQALVPFASSHDPWEDTGCGPAPLSTAPAFEASLLEEVMRIFDGNGLARPRYRALEDRIDSLLATLRSGGELREEVGTLLPLLAGMTGLRSEAWHSRLAPDLSDELEPPLLRVHHEGLAGLWTLAALGEKLAGRSGATELGRASFHLRRAEDSRFPHSEGALERLHAAMGGLSRVETFSPPPALAPLPGTCTPGERLTWTPFARAASVQVRGLPGARVTRGTLTWIPPHSGRYDVVVTGLSEQGWAFVHTELVCQR